MINFKILTIFAELFPGPLATSITGIALKKNLWQFETINIRDFAKDARKTVDDIIFGGGSGMLMKPDTIADAIDNSDIKKNAKFVYLSPKGKLFNQKIAQNFAKEEEIVILCGRYEGVDQRVIDYYNFEEISIGNYVLSGGEIASYIFIDAILRNVKGVLGNADSLKEESFSSDEFSLEYPQFTRPANWRGIKVDDVLTSGNHKKIKEYRISRSKKI